MTARQIDNRVNKINALQEQLDSLKKQIDCIKDELKAELTAANVDSIETGSYRVSYTHYQKSTVDSKALKAAGLYDLYTNKSTVFRFSITDVKEA